MTFYKKTDKFGFRKSKVCRSLCGALLGTVAVVSLATASTEIHADEATTSPRQTHEETFVFRKLDS
ncbi:putative cross-wall-targeting lipoprotein signal domain-containing protein [Streptococcus agalactiae]|nr:secreted protein [Streptococcus agalactiae]